MSAKKELELVSNSHLHLKTLHEKTQAKRLVVVLEQASLETIKVISVYSNILIIAQLERHDAWLF